MEQMNVKQLLDIIEILVKPCTEVKSKDINEALACNLKRASETYTQINELHSVIGDYFVDCKTEDNISWEYTCKSLEVLLRLKKCLQENEDELLSVSQQKAIKSLFQFIVSLGLLPYLLPGVGLGFDQRCPNGSDFKTLFAVSNISDMDKYQRLRGITQGILLVIEEKQLCGLYLSKHMEDLLAALCQLTMPLYKQPTPKLMSDRKYFQMKLSQLTSTAYQPLLINALMIIQGNKQSPRWLRQGVSKLLTERLIQIGGVIATIKAIEHTVNYENPNVVGRLESVARLIITPHTKDANSYYNTVIPQVIQLIFSDDVNVMRIGVLCFRVLYEKDKLSFDKHVVPSLFGSLLNSSVNCDEDQITRCIEGLHKCFAIPGSDLWAVPIEPIVMLSKIMYQIYCKICDSPVVIKKAVEDLLWIILSKSSNEQLNRIFSCLLLDENMQEIKSLPENLHIVFGDNGGIKIAIVDCGDPDSIIEYSKCILKLLSERDTLGRISKQLFLTLLNYSSTLNNELTEMKLFVTEMLAELSETESIQKNITDDSQSIVDFIDTLINNKLQSGDSDFDVLCIALVLLIAVMDEVDASKRLNWNKLKSLSASLPKLSNRTNNIEFKMLCDEIYSRILTRGVVKTGTTNADSTSKSKCQNTRSPKITKTVCEQALEEACDPLLPVRGHAMIELTRLISSGDLEAKAKKNTIICIFQENLKNEDSYLYLSAIEGMALLAAEFPDSVLVILAEEYSRTDTTVRLRVGEVLMRVVRRLGEMVPVYKNELLNSFLSGVRDSDNLVRASSLSNIGELCQILGFRIGPIAAEILNCVESVVATDPAPEPRRAAVMLLTLVLRGLQSEALNTLQSVLLPLYRTLKKIYLTDKDDVVKLHSQLAIEELNSATLSFLFPPESLSKRIHVLDPAF